MTITQGQECRSLTLRIWINMAGILDAKTRIFDTLVTQEGRRQFASGKMKAEFYSFTDAFSIYNTDTINTGSRMDETYRICFEATSLPQDQVTFEADDSGKLAAFRDSGFKIMAGQIFSGSAVELVTGSAFASLSSEMLSSASIEAFTKLRILGSPDFFEQQYNQFLIGNDTLSFAISDNMPISASAFQKGNIDQIESLFMDKRLSHIPNFKYLPPVNRARIGGTTSSLGTFPSLGQAPIVTNNDLENEFRYARQLGFQEEVTFYQTSKQNNLACQMFEVSGDAITKLDVIDFGIFTVPNDQEHPTKHVFFVGKVFVDGTGTSTFVNLFSLIFT